MSGVYYFDCKIDGGRQQEHSSADPDNPCPICRIATLEKVAEALCNPDVQLIIKIFARSDVTWANINNALRATDYLKEQGE